MAGVKSRTFTWRFDSPVGKVWPVLADSARFNEAAELPKHDIEEIPRDDGSVRYIGRARAGPFTLEWDDGPANWVDGQWFRHCRTFKKGPLRSLCATLRLSPDDDGCRGDYTLEAEAANLFGRLMLGTAFFQSAGRTFGRLADSAGDFASGRRDSEFDHQPPRLAPGAVERARQLVDAIEATEHGHGLAERLAEYVTGRQEVDVWAIRPLKLARLWGCDDRLAIEVCLEAARQGLLGLRWDLLCPRCQVGKETAPALDKLPRGAHCPTCNIDYGRDYTKNIELAFHPGRAIRPISGGEYCLYGPMSMPHVKVQLTLGPGTSRTITLQPAAAQYRLRTLEPGGETDVHWQGEGGFPEIVADGDSVGAGPAAAPGEVVLRNSSARLLTLVLEEREWTRHALTAERVFALQAFRDLFNSDVLRPGDDVEIDHVTLMFTDLKGSTALYDRLGDPAAYALVREHYAVLGKAVRDNDGAIVKTIGDAIMASFTMPSDALRCAVQMHDDVEAFNAASGHQPITIKLGLHVGRCIAVTLNKRLDYYGSAANKAARLEAQSRGGDIVMSAEFAGDPDTRKMLTGLSPVPETADLKGFDKPVPFLRITAEELAQRRRQSAGVSI
ncbi:MAG: adenylate/guanylate cyclase domain-containing protein [Rhodospirillales bacterium]|jgi:class 3 adenylate cyclase|nr:adenylate/guanylate cyclase domain-containing protein [Rhodospirillales bacterium]